MKKIISLLLALVMVLALGAGSFAATGELSTKTLVFAANADPTGMCPISVAFTGANAGFQNLLYDSLVTWDSKTYKIKPGIASSWKYLDKYKIEFKLRKDVTTDDGSKITSSDVLWSFKTAIALGKTAAYWTTYDIAKSYAPDEYTVVLVTKVTDPMALINLANIPYSILSEAAVTKNGGIANEHLKPTAGTGPYKFVSWVAGSSIKFERKTNYWGEKAYYKFMEGRIITDANSRLMSFESGEAAISYNPSPTDIDLVKNNKKFQIIDIPVHAVNMIFMNNENQYLKDVNNRRVLSLATDRASILKVALGGYGRLTDAFWGKLSGGYVQPKPGQTTYFRYSMADAKKLLAKTKNPKGFTIKFQYTPSTPSYTTYAQMLKNAWATLGINIELVPVDTASLTANFTNGTYDTGTAQSAGLDPARQLLAVDSRLGWKVANPATGYKGGAAFLKLIDGAKFSINEATRKSYYAKLNDWFAKEVPEYPLHAVNTNLLANANIGGVELNVMGSAIVRYCYEK